MCQVAEQMLLHLPATHDEANLLSCKLALDWGKKNIGNIHPNVEEVLKLVRGLYAIQRHSILMYVLVSFICISCGHS